MSERHRHFDLILIGGGVAGIAIARAAAVSGLHVLLLERERELAPVQSTKHHCWRHTGIRYALHQPEIARSLSGASEAFLSDAEGFIQPTAVYYVATELGTAQRYTVAWNDLGIPYEEVDRKEILQSEPLLNGSIIQRVFLSEDKVFSPHGLLTRLRNQAVETGRVVMMTDSEVTSFITDPEGRVVGVKVRDRNSGDQWYAEGALTINATGARARELLATAGVFLSPKEFKLFKAHLIVSKRVTQNMFVFLDDCLQVVVPHANPGVSVLDAGSDIEIHHPDDVTPEPWAVEHILNAVARVVVRVQLRQHAAYCCVKAEFSRGRDWSMRGKKPGIAVVRHLPGLLSAWPGKFSAYPILVEEVMKHVQP